MSQNRVNIKSISDAQESELSKFHDECIAYGYTDTNVSFEEIELAKLKAECRKFGYKAFLRFGELHIRTRFEAWYFFPNDNGCIKLMHGNTIGPEPERYHKQFSRKMNYHQLVCYIHEHEEAKYAGKAVNFTFTKTGAYKKAFA